MDCKEYTLDYKKIFPRTLVRFYGPNDIRYDHTVENNGYNYFYYSNSVLCDKCFVNNCGKCKELVSLTELVYCEGCNLKICGACGNFRRAENISCASAWNQSALFCSSCVDNFSCRICNQKNGILNVFAKCGRCETWNCLTTCTRKMETEGPGSNGEYTFVCAKCDNDDHEQEANTNFAKRKKIT